MKKTILKGFFDLSSKNQNGIFSFIFDDGKIYLKRKYQGYTKEQAKNLFFQEIQSLLVKGDL